MTKPAFEQLAKLDLRNWPPVRIATDEEVRRECGISREEWLRRWRDTGIDGKERTDGRRR